MITRTSIKKEKEYSDQMIKISQESGLQDINISSEFKQEIEKLLSNNKSLEEQVNAFKTRTNEIEEKYMEEI